MSLGTDLFFLVLLLNQRWSPPLRLQASHCNTYYYYYYYYYYYIALWHYSPVRTFVSLMDSSQSALSCDISFQFWIQHLSISGCTQFHHLCFCRSLCRLPLGLSLNTWPTFLLQFILLTWPIKFNRLIRTAESTGWTQKYSLISSSYKIKTYWNILTKLVATVA
jgi:hypothetical protein